jgi:peptidyl-tRNA hydrolase
MSNIRLVTVVRRDLQMPVGLVAEQVAHITDSFMGKGIAAASLQPVSLSKSIRSTIKNPFTQAEVEWMIDPYLSVLAVNTCEELQIIEDKARAEGIKVNAWIDVIPSQILNGQAIRCKIGISIGPDDFDKIKIVTGTLPLF